LKEKKHINSSNKWKPTGQNQGMRPQRKGKTNYKSGMYNKNIDRHNTNCMQTKKTQSNQQPNSKKENNKGEKTHTNNVLQEREQIEHNPHIMRTTREQNLDKCKEKRSLAGENHQQK